MNPWRIPYSILFQISLALFALQDVSGAGSFDVGVGRRDITPKESVPMWGYGARHDALSQGALDPLLATALVINASGTKLAVVGLDLGRAPAEKTLLAIRRRVLEATGIEHSLIAGSHTHSGPVLELSDEVGKGKGRFDAAIRYTQQLEDAIVQAVVEANQGLQPAKFASGSKLLEGFNRNRHTKIEPKPVDRIVRVLRFDDLAGKPIGILVNFSAHPTMMPSETLKFSADYVGAIRRFVEETMGGKTVFMQGAAGDLSVDSGGAKEPSAYGQKLGAQVVELASGLVSKEAGLPSLKVREERFKFSSRTDFSNPFIRAAFSLAFFPELIPNFIDEYAQGIQPRLTVVLLNNEIAIVGASGEFFCNHALRLRERARVNDLFFFGYCNGYHQYFPTIEAAAEGGYGADTRVAPVQVGAGEEMMNAALTWLYTMQGSLN